MIVKSNYILLTLFTSLIISCGANNYILKNDIPSLETGFFGFRWTTPMSIIDSEFPRKTGAKQRSDLNRFSTSCFSDAYFLDELTSLCQFRFNENGLNSVKIIFESNQVSAEDQLFKLKEKLSSFYGEPYKTLGTNKQNEKQEYIVGFFWDGGRLELTLKLNYTIEVNAYSYSSRFGPIHNG